MKAVIFDNEQVIVDTDWDYVSKTVSEEFELPVESGKDFKRRLQKGNKEFKNPLNQWSKGLVSREKFWGYVLDNYGLASTKTNVDIISSKLENLTTNENQDVVGLIKKLKDSGYKVFMLSNSTPEIEKGNKKRNSYFSLFDRLYFSHEQQARKPERNSYTTVLDENNLNPRDCVMVDDKEENLIVASDVGIKSLQYHTKQPITELYEGLRILGISI